MFDGGASWKNLNLVANETKSPFHSFIEKPIKFTMRNGILSEIIVSENEPGKIIYKQFSVACLLYALQCPFVCRLVCLQERY